MMSTAGGDAITKNISGPKRVQVDGVIVEQFGMEELIEADRYLESKKAVRKGLGIRMVRVEPPGATG
jgi:hypothetical protein